VKRRSNDERSSHCADVENPVNTILAIDLGTTNIVAAGNGSALPLSCEKGRTSLPSAVAFLPNGTTEVGTAAKFRRSIDPDNSIFSAKRIIGRRWEEQETKEFCNSYPMSMIEKDGAPHFMTRAGLFSATDVASILLSMIHEEVSSAATGFESVVMTVPPPFSERQRVETLVAADTAGFRDVQLVHEPVATAYAFGNVSNRVARAGVFDLGGGTFDFSVVDWTRDTPSLVCSQTNLSIGGDDIDQQIAKWVADQVLEEHNWDLRNYSEINTRLLLECERAKIRLSFFEETAIELHKIDPDGPAASQELEIRRADLDVLSEDLVRQTFVTCDQVLREADVRPQDLEAIFLAGGSTHLSKVREGVEIYFGQPGRFELEPTEVVAIGASLME
jgi:molecular chaperone DnaK